MYRKHGPDHVVLITQVWPLIPIDDPDFLEWKALGNEPEEQGDEQPRKPYTIDQLTTIADYMLEPAAPEPEVKPLGYPDEGPNLEAENQALREENERLRKELQARPVEPPPLSPPPVEEFTTKKLADYYIPAEIRDLMEEGETFPQARKRLSELLNVEKAELRLKRAAGSATEAELKREADVDRLQGLFSKLGEI